MPCPKYENCGLRKTFESDALLEGTFNGEKLHPREYGAIDMAMRIITERFCESDNGFRQCEEHKQRLFSSQCPEDDILL